MKHLVIAFILVSFSALVPIATPALAIEPEAEAAGKLVVHAVEKDQRVAQLEGYLGSHDSPMIDSSSHFIQEADRLHLDWKLVAAIAGVESTFGKHIPTSSFNAWGWGVFTGTQSGVNFKDWNEGITQVSEGLRYNYIDRGAETIEQMGRIYAASPAWAWKVRFFLEKIEAFAPVRTDQLAVTI